MTPSLDEFRRAYAADDNEWWRLECGHHMNLFEAALEALDAARSRIAELEAQQPKPAGYVVGWQENRLYLALDNSDLTSSLEDIEPQAFATLGGARMFAAECGPEDPLTRFRVYELREVSDRG
ncbi:hypothetical protein [Nocardia cyriacigeorgica]|uniref:hypothetical protein n=1 Tax=Nocardia cyriacigeorgica TaxID=135487 RepID=UPI002454902F|nr:hypothetical protein [Nocardia cyriacigeorgica]